jgi:hypothetical protein
VTVLPPGLIHASRNPDMTRSGLKVLIRLYETLNCGEFRKVQTWFVANQLRTDESTVRRGLEQLEHLGYIVRGARDGNCFTFRLTSPEAHLQPTPPGSPVAA